VNVLLLNAPAPPGDLIVNRANYCCDYSKALYRKQPIDLVVLSGVLAPAHEVAFLDGAAPGFRPDDLRRALARRRADAIVVLVGDLTRESDAAFVRRLRMDAPDALLVGTGDLCRFDPAGCQRDLPELDAFLLDFTTPSLLRFLTGESNLRNVVARRDTRPLPAPAREPVFDIAPPAHELFVNGRYRPALALHGRIAETLFSFGCPHGCRYCLMESIPYTPRTMASARRELRRLNELGLREIHFCDATFAAVRGWAEELLAVMARESRQVWWASTRVDVVDADMARRMARAGCHTLTLGVETASDALQQTYRKRIDRERIREAFAACRAAGIRTLAHVILGLPGETPETLRETVDFVLALDPFYLSLNVMEAWKGTSFGDGYRERHGEHPKSVVGTTYFYPQEASLPLDVVLARRDEAVRRFYLSPRRWWRYARAIRTRYELEKYLWHGLEVVRRYRRERRESP
jgi:radical SAM superfamily enzyme YgiQ (UPF0313 family)